MFFSALELGTLDSSRRAVGSGFLVQSEFTGLDTTTTSYNAYIMNSFSPNKKTSFLFSALYSHVDVEIDVTPRHTLGSNVVYTSDRILRGDEANLLTPASGGTTVDLFGEFAINSMTHDF